MTICICICICKMQKLNAHEITSHGTPSNIFSKSTKTSENQEKH